MKLLDVNGLSKSFGGVAALRQVQGHSVAGETLGMIGPNGSGKTTFVNIVSGHVRPDSGSLTFDGIDITGKNPHQLAAIGLCRTYQAVRVFSSLSTQPAVLASVQSPAPPTGDAISISITCKAPAMYTPLHFPFAYTLCSPF